MTKSKSKKLSIVIPCYNDNLFLKEAVKSALAQNWENKEIILVDDGSDEKTKNIIKKLEPHIDILITQENHGVSAARNAGIKAASGEYILTLDSDDYFEPEFGYEAISIFMKHPESVIVTCFSRWFGSGKESKTFKPGGGTIKEALINNIAMGSCMFKKTSWEMAKGYDEKMFKGFEDWEFYIRLLKNGGEAHVIPKVLFHYRNKPASRNKKANMEKYELLKYIYFKHSDLYKDNFEFFIREWLTSIQKSEAFKQRVMDSLDFKVGHKILKPLRLLGFYKR